MMLLKQDLLVGKQTAINASFCQFHFDHEYATIEKSEERFSTLF